MINVKRNIRRKKGLSRLLHKLLRAHWYSYANGELIFFLRPRRTARCGSGTLEADIDRFDSKECLGCRTRYFETDDSGFLLSDADKRSPML